MRYVRLILANNLAFILQQCVGERRVMNIKELLKFIDRNQKIIICYSWHQEIFKGKAKEVNPFDEKVIDAEVDFIYLDDDLYTKDYIKIKVKKD